MPPRASLLLALAAAALAAGAACVSDRETTGPSQSLGDCQLPLDSSTVGATVAPVGIRNFAFIPNQIHVRAGTTVTWVNCESPGTPAHTSTSDTGVWGSSDLQPGATF